MTTSLTDNLVGISMEHWVRGLSFPAFQEALTKSQELGYTSMTLPLEIPSWSMSPTCTDASKIRQAVAAANMTLVVEYKLRYDHRNQCDQELESIYHHDDEVVKHALDRLMEALELTEQLGSEYMGGCLYSERWQCEQRRVDYNAEDYEEQQEAKNDDVRKAHTNCRRALQTLASAAQTKGISIGVQDPYPFCWCNYSFLDDIDEPNLKLHFVVDQQSDKYQDGSLKRDLAHYGDRLGYISFVRKSLSLLVPSRMLLDVDDADTEFFGALRGISYRGPVVLDHMVPASSLATSMMSPTFTRILERSCGNSKMQAAESMMFLLIQLRLTLSDDIRANLTKIFEDHIAAEAKTATSAINRCKI